MKQYIPALLSVVVVAGCGGSDLNSSSTESLAAQNRFAGSYSGTWTAFPSDSGTVTLSVSGSGAVTGEMYDKESGQTGTVTGNINSNGTLSATIEYPYEAPFAVGGGFTLASGKLSGSGTGSIYNSKFSVNFNLTQSK